MPTIATYYKAATKTTTTVSHITYFLTDNHKPQSPNSRNNGAVESRWQKVRIRIHLNTWEPNAKKCCPTLWSTYREVDIGNWWSSCHKNLDNLCMSCPCCQVKWAGTLVVGAITRGFIAKQQLHDVSVKTKKGEWLKKENSKPNFSSLWNSNTNASCIFFFWWILKLEEELESHTIPKVHFLSKKFISKSTKNHSLGWLTMYRLGWVEFQIIYFFDQNWIFDLVWSSILKKFFKAFWLGQSEWL